MQPCGTDLIWESKDSRPLSHTQPCMCMNTCHLLVWNTVFFSNTNLLQIVVYKVIILFENSHPNRASISSFITNQVSTQIVHNFRMAQFLLKQGNSSSHIVLLVGLNNICKTLGMPSNIWLKVSKYLLIYREVQAFLYEAEFPELTIDLPSFPSCSLKSSD